jgi:hypothetical protein
MREAEMIVNSEKKWKWAEAGRHYGVPRIWRRWENCEQHILSSQPRASHVLCLKDNHWTIDIQYECDKWKVLNKRMQTVLKIIKYSLKRTIYFQNIIILYMCFSVGPVLISSQSPVLSFYCCLHFLPQILFFCMFINFIITSYTRILKCNSS